MNMQEMIPKIEILVDGKVWVMGKLARSFRIILILSFLYQGFTMATFLETERLYMRSFEKSDVHVFAEIFADPEVQEFSKWGVMSLEETQYFIDHVTKPRADGIELLVVVNKKEKRVIGNIGL